MVPIFLTEAGAVVVVGGHRKAEESLDEEGLSSGHRILWGKARGWRVVVGRLVRFSNFPVWKSLESEL